MKVVYSISDLPNIPAVYAMYGGRDKKHVAYVGIGRKLKVRINEHLVRRISSVATGTYAVGLKPDYVTEVKWWEHSKFKDDNFLYAAELVAFDVLNPALRSRGKIPDKAKMIYKEQIFKKEMENMFNGKSSGKLVTRTLINAFNRIEELEHRIQKIEEKLFELIEKR